MFSEQLAAWRDFYVAAATSAAALVGLLFVSLSLHGMATRGDMTSIARTAFVAYVSILIVSFLVLTPTLNETVFGVTLIVAAAVNGRASIAVLLGVIRGSRSAIGRGFALVRLVISVLALLLLATAGTLSLWAKSDFNLIALSIAVLGIQAARSSWDLLIARESS